MILRLFFFLAFLIFLSSCDSNILFEENHEISNQNWSHADTLNFKFGIADTTEVINLWLDVEHSVDYSFQNLYVQIFTKFPNGMRHQDLLSLELADKTGWWFGKCDSEMCRTSIMIQEHIYFPEEGDYEITLKQFMRVDPLEGVKNFGVRIERTGEKRAS